MEDSASIFDELLRLLEELAAPLAAQIRDEVTRGRLVEGQQLPTLDQQERQSRLKEANLGRIAKDELAVVQYSGDERLALLCETLLTLANSMTESRRALLEFTNAHGMPHAHIRFALDDDTHALELDLEREVTSAEAALAKVRAALGPVREEVGTWH